MSKQAKEAKRAERANEASEASGFKLSTSFGVDPLTAVGVVGVIGMVAYYGYNNFSKEPSKKSFKEEDHTVVSVVHEPAEVVKPKRVYRQLDTLG